MEQGKLSISIMVNDRSKVVDTVMVKGATFEEIRKAAKEKIKEFEGRNEKLVVCCASVQLLLWV